MGRSRVRSGLFREDQRIQVMQERTAGQEIGAKTAQAPGRTPAKYKPPAARTWMSYSQEMMILRAIAGPPGRPFEQEEARAGLSLSPLAPLRDPPRTGALGLTLPHRIREVLCAVIVQVAALEFVGRDHSGRHKADIVQREVGVVAAAAVVIGPHDIEGFPGRPGK